MQTHLVDSRLLDRFEEEVETRVPYVDRKTGEVVNPTPLVDLTEALVECAKSEYGIDIAGRGARVFGKFDSKIFGGSVKVRPAVQILEDAIASGALTREKTVFEATSGNFGLALALLGKLGVRVVALVSRQLQPGVLERLKADGVNLLNLDIDICPAPGVQMDPNVMVAKAAALGVRQQLAELGFDAGEFDEVKEEAEQLLARQDAIGLAKLLARAYGGFCPQQYENELNVLAHENVTGPEIDQQLKDIGLSLAQFDVVCAFGTGGTATGLSRYLRKMHQRKSVRVVFPLPDQDVAGIRTRQKAAGLRFYEPEAYAGEHQVDFDGAKRLLKFLNDRGHDVGESGALALYATLELVNFGAGERFVVLIADGSGKYSKVEPTMTVARTEVTLQEAAARSQDYSAVVWTHGALVPREEGIRAIAAALGVDEKTVRVAKVREVQTLMAGKGIPEVFGEPDGGRKLLLVCRVGGTSLNVAKLLGKRGFVAESLIGGIVGIPSVKGKQPFEYLQQATE